MEKQAGREALRGWQVYSARWRSKAVVCFVITRGGVCSIPYYTHYMVLDSQDIRHLPRVGAIQHKRCDIA